MNVDERNEKLGYKIREARLEKVPYMLIVGAREEEENMVSVRSRDAAEDKQNLGMMPVEKFLEQVLAAEE